MTFDNQTFGGFTSSLLENIRDELPKHPILSFPVLSSFDPSSIELDENVRRSYISVDPAGFDSLVTYSSV